LQIAEHAQAQRGATGDGRRATGDRRPEHAPIFFLFSFSFSLRLPEPDENLCTSWLMEMTASLRTQSDVDMPHEQERPLRSLFGEILLAYLCWAVGFIIFVHWLLLTCLSRRYRKRCDFGTLLQFILPLLALAIFAGGGAWCRSSSNGVPNYRTCPGGETMSNECLFNVQSTKYQAIYTMHYIGLACMVIQFILDGVQIWGWVMQIRQIDDDNHSSNTVYSQKRSCFMILWSPYTVTAAYPITILFITFWVTLTWAVFYKDWSTDIGGSLTSLAWRVIVAGLGALSGGLLFLHHGRIGRCSTRA